MSTDHLRCRANTFRIMQNIITELQSRDDNDVKRRQMDNILRNQPSNMTAIGDILTYPEIKDEDNGEP